VQWLSICPRSKNVVAEVAEVAAKAHSLIAAEYAGTTVSQMTAMRKKARETGVYLKVVKNTLASRAVEGTDFAVAKDSLVGPLLYAFSTEEPGAAGRLIKEFAKGNDKLQAKVVVVEGQQYGQAHVEVLASLPTLEQALGMLPACCRSRPACSPAPSRPWPTSRVVAMPRRKPRPSRPNRPDPGAQTTFPIQSKTHPEVNQMSLSNEQIVDAIAGKTLMEVMELVKAIEEKFGVSAAAPVAAAGPAAAAAGRRADRVHRHPEAGRRQEGRSDQGRPRHHRPGPEGSQGPHRGRWHRQGSRDQGRRREDQEGS
jgi:large subunit ribosomal protein L10